LAPCPPRAILVEEGGLCPYPSESGTGTIFGFGLGARSRLWGGYSSRSSLSLGARAQIRVVVCRGGDMELARLNPGPGITLGKNYGDSDDDDEDTLPKHNYSVIASLGSKMNREIVSALTLSHSD
jgi:hypothetical protein